MSYPKKISRHLPHYFSLIGLLAAGAIGILVFSNWINIQAGIVAAMAVSYVIWGIIHHLIHKDLYLTVVLEYAVVAVLGAVILLSLLYWK